MFRSFGRKTVTRRVLAILMSLMMVLQSGGSYAQETGVGEPSAVDISAPISLFDAGLDQNPARFFEGTLVHEGADYTVTATIGQDAQFPRDVRMQVEEIRPGSQMYAHYSEMTGTELDKDWDEVGAFARFFDITFVTYDNGEEKEIEPAALIDVEIIFQEAISVAEDAEVQTVHIDRGNTEKLDTETDSSGVAIAESDAVDTVTFSSDSFSVYGVVQTVKKQTKVKTARGDTYLVEVSYSKDSGIPDDAVVKASEITESNPDYGLYQEQADLALMEKGSRLDGLAGLFDIGIYVGDEKIQPNVPVSVTVSLEEGIDSGKQLQVVHFPQGIEKARSSVTQEGNSEGGASAGSDGEDAGGTEAAREPAVSTEVLPASVKGEAATFEAGGFSVYVLAYTVDFHYEGTDYSIEGNSQILLSELISQLNITDEDGNLIEAAKAASVEFTDEHLVTVQQVSGIITYNGNTEKDVGEKDFLLSSLEPFSTAENLIIRMEDGREIRVSVTDDQQTGSNVWDLADQNNTEYLHAGVESSVTENEQERNSVFTITFTYSLKENVVKAMDELDSNVFLTYDLSQVLANSPLKSIQDKDNGSISVGSRKIGTYKIVNNVVTIEFTDPSYLDGRTSLVGYYKVTVETDETKIVDGESTTFSFPGTTDTIPITYKPTVEDGSKSFYDTQDEDGNYTLHYSAAVKVNYDCDSMTFLDTLSGLQTLDASSVKVGGRSVSVTQNGNGFTFDMGTALGTSGVKAGTYTVTYDTKLTAQQLKNMAADKTLETNTAAWKVNGTKDVPGGHTEKEYDKPREPIPVTKTITDGSTAKQPGDTITYSVTYGNEKTVLAGFEIADYMTDVQILQGNITMQYNGQTVTMPASAIPGQDTSYSKVNMTTLFDYTFPDNTQGYGPVVVTYTTRLIDADTAKANGVYDTTDVYNTAEEKRQNTRDTVKTTVAYEKEPSYYIEKTETSTKDADGKWAPGTTVTYTLTIGDSATNMAGVNIRDHMTDLQVLQGDVMIRVGNSQTVRLSDYVYGAVKYTDDGSYSANDVLVFNFDMPSSAGNGPVVITYQTKIIDDSQGISSQIFGETPVKNTAFVNNNSDHVQENVTFEDYPVSKSVTQSNADVNGQTVAMGSVVHYTITFGQAGMNMKGALIEDYMTDLQKLSSAITVRKADGSSFTMPAGTGQWSESGNNWDFWDDGKYSDSNILLFKYRLPDDIGDGPVTVEYDAAIISEQEANETGVNGTKTARNTFKVDGHQADVSINIDFPTAAAHNPSIRKEFDHWDVENSRVYWNIILEKDEESAYPLYDVSWREAWDRNEVSITEGTQGYYGRNQFDGTYFDTANAVVTTDDGTILTPGKDYTINVETTTFTFPVLNERVHINLAFLSPAKIINGYYMKNKVRTTSHYPEKDAVAEATYYNPDIEIVKNGTYDEQTRLIKWEVTVNPSALSFTDSDPIAVMFSDAVPQGLTVVNYSDHSDQANPSIYVGYDGNQVSGTGKEQQVTIAEETNCIGPVDIAAHNVYGNQNAGLNNQRYRVTYYTKVSDEEWDRITSSPSGTKTYVNHATVTANGSTFEAVDQVTVAVSEYLTKTDDTKSNEGVIVDADGNRTKEISFTIEINPMGYNLNNGKVLSLTDFIDTNMDLDPNSVKIMAAVRGEDGKLTATGAASGSIETSYNDDTRLLSIRNIPDKTPLLLTYKCIARAQGQDKFSNTATLIGGGSHSATDTETHTIQTDSAGTTVDGLEIYIYKIDENDITKHLSGAEFQLYECELEIGDLSDTSQYNQNYWDVLLASLDNGTYDDAAIRSQFKIKNYKPIGEPVVTQESGYVTLPAIREHKVYAWKEVKAPDNYTANDDYHYFVAYQYMDVNSNPPASLSDEEQTNRKHAAWALDDAAQLANGIRIASIANFTTWTATNVESRYTSISATKVWENDSDNLFRTRPVNGIRLQLVRINADGTRENVGEPVSVNADKQGRWPTYIWGKLPANDGNDNTLKYTVVEDRVENYTTTYSDNGQGQSSGTITVTNRMIPRSTNIHVRKVFDDDSGDERPDRITVRLMEILTDNEGVAGTPEEVATWELNEMNEWKHSFEGLETKRVVDGVPYTLTYTVVEDTDALTRAGFDYIVTYSDQGEGVVETTEEDPLVITNTKPRVGSLKIKKAITVDGAALTDANRTMFNGTYILRIYRDGEQDELHSVALTVENGAVTAASVDDVSAVIDEDGYITIESLDAGKYLIVEDSITAPNGFVWTATGREVTVTSGGIAEQTVTNNFIPDTTDVPVEKTWEPALANGTEWSATFKLKKSERLFSVNGYTVTEAQTWSEWADTEAAELTITQSSTADQKKFPAQPRFRVDGNSVHEIRYTVEEISNNVTGSDDVYTATSITEGSAANGYTVAVTNGPDPTRTKIRVEKVWAGEVTTGTSTMVLYRSTGDTPAAPTNTFNVTINAVLDHTPAAAGHIVVQYTGDKGDSGSMTLNNVQGWTGRTVSLKRGQIYSFTFTADGTKVKTVTPVSANGISDATTIGLTAEAEASRNYTVTFHVDDTLRNYNDGTIGIASEGRDSLLFGKDNWGDKSFEAEEGSSLSYTVSCDGRFITAVTPESGSCNNISGNQTVNLTATTADKTTDISVRVDWGSNADKAPADAAVTVTFSGSDGSTVTETLNSSGWEKTVQLPVLDADGNPITYTVSYTPTSAEASDGGAITYSGENTLSGTSYTVNAAYEAPEQTVSVIVDYSGVSSNYQVWTGEARYDGGNSWQNAGTKVTDYNNKKYTFNGLVPGTTYYLWISGQNTTTNESDQIYTITGADVYGDEANHIYAFTASEGKIIHVTDPQKAKTVTVVHGKHASYYPPYLCKNTNVRSDSVVVNIYIWEEKSSWNLEGWKLKRDDGYQDISPSTIKKAGTGKLQGTNADAEYWLVSFKVEGINTDLELTLQTYDWPWKYNEVTGTSVANSIIPQSTSSSGLNNVNRFRSRLIALAGVSDTPASAGTTFADASVGGIGTAFSTILFKDLPSGAEPATDIAGYEQVLSDNGSYTWSNLPKYDDDGNQIYYYVVEKTASASASSISVEYAYTYNAEDDPASGINTVTVTNAATAPQKADISVTKNVQVNGGGSDELSGETIRVGLFTSEPEANATPDQMATLSLTGAQTTAVLFSNLDLGTYWVYELDGSNHPVKNGQTIALKGKTYSVGESAPGVTLNTANETKNVTITNSRTTSVVPGRITVHKVDQAGDALSGATFTLYANDQTTVISTYTSQTFSIGTGDSVLSGYLPTGSETVTLYLKETVTPEGYSGDKEFHPVTISRSVSTSGSNTTVTYTMLIDDVTEKNIVNPQVGNLTVSKTVFRTSTEENTEEVFTLAIALTAPEDGPALAASYKVMKNNGTTTDAAVTNGVISLGLKAGESFTIQGLPAGTVYDVTEENIPDGWALQGIVWSDTNRTISVNDEDTVTVTNTDQCTSIEVEKKWIDTTGVRSATFRLWQKAEADSVWTYTNKEVTLRSEDEATHHWKYTWENLPSVNAAGSKYLYRVEEAAWDPSTAVPIKPENYEQGIESGTMVWVNYCPESFPDKITVKKIWLDENGDSLNAADKNENIVITGKIQSRTIKPKDNSGYHISFLRNGNTLDYNYTIGSNNARLHIWAAGNGTVSDANNSFAVSGTSTYTTFSISGSTQINVDPTVFIKRVMPEWDKNEDNDVISEWADYRTFTLDKTNDWSQTVEKPESTEGEMTEYRITDVQEEGGGGYTLSYENNDGIMTGAILVVNRKNESGAVSVSKTFAFPEDAELSVPEEFGITAGWGTNSIVLGNTETGLREGSTLPNGVTVARSVSGSTYTWTIYGLPAGTEVTFTETGYGIAGYIATSTVTQYNADQSRNEETSGTSGRATVSSDSTLPDSARVAFKNTYAAGVELPATGGPGTVIYTVAGLGMILLAGGVLMRRRKRYQK